MNELILLHVIEMITKQDNTNIEESKYIHISKIDEGV